MGSGWKSALAITTLGAALVGCANHRYQDERPPSNQVEPGGLGLQGYDVISASDKMSSDLLADPKLNADTTQWTIVVGNMEDHTTGLAFTHDYDIFLSRLKTNLARDSHGRVTLIENRDKFNYLRGKELDSAAPQRDDLGQGGGNTGGGAPSAVQPDFVLHGVVRDMPNRNSNYFLLEFDLTNLRNRTIAWTKPYEVTVGR